MGLKKKNRVSAEFNMSSLTDIIFLLLIFFMLTSSLVVPNALNLKLPGKKSTVSVKSKPPKISISAKGTYFLNGTKASMAQLEKAVREEKKKNKDKAAIMIKANPNANVEHVVAIMDLAYRYSIQPIMDL